MLGRFEEEEVGELGYSSAKRSDCEQPSFLDTLSPRRDEENSKSDSLLVFEGFRVRSTLGLLIILG